MPSSSKPELAVSALLHNLNEELDRKKRIKPEDLILSTKSPKSVRGRLGPRINEQDSQIGHCRGRGELCGAIFMCNKRTWKECLGQCLFGLPIGKKPLVEKIVPGMKLFLFEYEKRQLWGVFEAASYGGMDIIPDAYSGGSFPCQVRVKVPEECVALYEGEFCAAIRDNYFSIDKFHFELSGKQVCHLSSLFERKYFRAKRMHSDVIEYKDKQHRYNLNGGAPLLLTNDAACLYAEDLNVTSLPPSLYSSRCQVLEDQPFSNSEKGVDFVSKNIENFNNSRSSDTGSLALLPNGAYEIVQNDRFPLHFDIASLTKIGGQLGKGFDTVNASRLTCYDTNNHSIVEDFGTGDLVPDFSTMTKRGSIETLLYSDNLSRLHSDRPIGKSVWTRISGRSKPNVASNGNITHAKEKSVANSVLSLPLEVPASPEIAMANGSFADAKQESAEKCSVGFKRRRGNTNNATTNTDETPRRRRKLTRPVFEANAPGCCQGNDNMQAEQNVCQANTLDLNVPVELPVEVSTQQGQGVAISLHDKGTLDDENRYPVGVSGSQVSVDAELQSFVKREQHSESSNHAGTVSLTTQDTVNSVFWLRGEIDGNNPADLIGDLQKQPRALASLRDVNQDSTSISNALSQQVDGEGNGFPDIEEQGFNFRQAHIFSECASSELVAADSSRAGTLSLAPCTSEKDFLESFNPIINQADDRKGFAIQSCGLAQDVPLVLELGNDVKIYDNGNPEHVSDDLSKAEAHNEAVVRDASSSGNLSRQPETILVDCTSNRNLLNQDLKSFLSGLQVSGIKLQLGSSPCLILQLGDQSGSNSNVDSQGQE